MGGSLQKGDPCLSFLVQPVGLCPSLLMLYQEERGEEVHRQGEPAFLWSCAHMVWTWGVWG